jgi:hypothetical protein
MKRLTAPLMTTTATTMIASNKKSRTVIAVQCRAARHRLGYPGLTSGGHRLATKRNETDEMMFPRRPGTRHASLAGVERYRA